MAANARDSKSPLLPDDPSLIDMLAVFRRGSVLVDAALSTLDALNPKINALKRLIKVGVPASMIGPQIVRLLLSLGPMLDAADADGDNLLLVPKGHAAAQPLVVFTLARQTSGTLSVQSIEIDRAAIAFSDGDKRESGLIFDRLVRAGRDMVDPDLEDPISAFCTTLDAFMSHMMCAASRLSIAKARFDLQSSFLSAVTQADAGSSAVSLDGHLDGSGARDMAMETRRLLSRQSKNIASGNRETLRDLLEVHAPQPTA